MARNLALILGGAALVLLGQGVFAPGFATPMAHIHAIKTGPKVKLPKAKPPPAETAPPKGVEQPAGPHPFHGLMEADTTEVRTKLGAPDVARGEGAGAMWTYRLPDCALFVFFKAPKHAPADAGARVSGAASGPRVRGQRPLPVNECIAEAMNRQASGAGGAP
jgi:hypothetical protein